ncbi:hydroxysteroid 11-beta-dehydrogenase 1-like protein isoform X2 [Ammospiza caudacuta]|uniref:hydroxysteroid 11-beta-dehydrogenase 1-like protein isoform X2 n=1 Tax=Ammospiza caudacuta TaxID=2857398 RepID=UPI0027397AC1|nr:hydroxysteroid 11-beta-dehydrogenase 1-like protein isoform X2 [Ammospiza caudacuta]
MKPIGKVLCATGVVAGLIAFFWKDDFNPESLSGARVLVTGASAGIGEQIAYHYARFGAEIVLTARREAVLQKVMEKCLTLGAKKIFYIPADMSSPSEPERVVQFAVQKLGGLDYLVLNHIGTNRFQEWAGDVEYTRWLLQVNFLSYVALATAALPTLEKNRGALVVVSSLTDSFSMDPPYTHFPGVFHSPFSLSRENAHSLHHFLLCHQVCPGWILQLAAPRAHHAEPRCVSHPVHPGPD